jgi:hypothetical protein
MTVEAYALYERGATRLRVDLIPDFARALETSPERVAAEVGLVVTTDRSEDVSTLILRVAGPTAGLEQLTWLLEHWSRVRARHRSLITNVIDLVREVSRVSSRPARQRAIRTLNPQDRPVPAGSPITIDV